MQYLVVLAIVAALLIFLWPVALAVLAAYLLYVVIDLVYRIIRVVRKNRYFRSEIFLQHKQATMAVVEEHNEITRYVAEIRESGSFQIGSSSTGTQAHLATFENTSRQGYRRDRNLASYRDENVHNCSLQVVRNAGAEPIKYVMKYFKIKPDETTLVEIEDLGEKIYRLENAVENLRQREAGITHAISPPAFILKHYQSEFMAQIGLELSQVEVPYSTYVFEYVSAGGNSAQKTTVTMDTPTIDSLVDTLSLKIRSIQSAAGQRALMTARLRESIKIRDNYTCQYCSVSVAMEPHLLLEIDHIKPVSKGGLSAVENLQALCWRCNRSKSNKVLEA